MKQVRDDLEALLDKLGLLQKVKGFYPVVKWDDIVGVELAKYTKPLKYENETLLIGVSSPLFKRELEGMQKELISIIKEKSGGETPIKRLSFKVFSVERKSKKKISQDESIIENCPVELDDNDYKWVDELVARFKGDEILKQSYRRVLVAYKLSEKKMEKLGYKRCAKCGALFDGRGKLCPVCEIEDKRRQ